MANHTSILAGKSQVSHSSWGGKESDTIEHSHTYKLGEEEQVRQKKGKNDLSKGLRAGEFS